MAIADVNYVNIRSQANTNSKILGKLYSKGTATILEEEEIGLKLNQKRNWVHKSRILITGSKVYEMIEEVKTKRLP